MDEHVVGDGEKRLLEADARRDGHLEATHVTWVARVLQTVLVTLHEELEEKPATKSGDVFVRFVET